MSSDARDEVEGWFCGPTVAVFVARWVLGLIFFMAGWWKVFDLGAVAHAENMFVQGFAETWIPEPLLWGLGMAIPCVELVAGATMCLGLRVRNSGLALGAVLIVVTYGHLLLQPLFDTTSHIFPRTVLLVFVLMVPAGVDRLSVDHLLTRRK